MHRSENYIKFGLIKEKILLITLWLISTQSFAQSYKPMLAWKRLILEGATCARFEFNKTATYTIKNL